MTLTALSIVAIRNLIIHDGHLHLEGDETKAELKEALLNLYTHVYPECQQDYGIPIATVVSRDDIHRIITSGRHPKSRA